VTVSSKNVGDDTFHVLFTLSTATHNHNSSMNHWIWVIKIHQ